MQDVVRLRSDTSLHVSYADQTLFGSPVSLRADNLVRNIFAPLLTRLQRDGVRPDHYARRSDILDEVRASPLFRSVTTARDQGAWNIRDEALYPSPALARPAILSADGPDAANGISAKLPASYWSQVHAVIAALCGPGLRDAELARLPVDIRGMVEAFLDRGLARSERTGRSEPPGPMRRADLTFIGHNTVLVRDGVTTIILDPFFRESSAEYPETYQPLQLGEIGTLDAVFLTHSHPDHFDPASLLRIPPTTTVYAPAVERESLLTVDMARRLEELGFSDVRTLRWGDTARVGAMEVRALPFFGEQPTDSEWLHPEVRNQGCTYLVKTSTWTGAFLADSGADHAGSVKAMAMECRRQLGPIDVVFSGYRGWTMYPAQLFGSSIARYLLFVPPDCWGTRMQLMNSIDDALDVAERWGARYLCPYGDGGAPWYWNIRLGPRLDGTGAELLGFDPFPERVAAAAAARSVTVDGRPVKSSVEVFVLRPGDSLQNLSAPEGPTRLLLPGHRWPFGGGRARPEEADGGAARDIRLM